MITMHLCFSVKTKEGELGIYPGHLELIAVLEIDEMKVTTCDDETTWIGLQSMVVSSKSTKI